MALTLQQLEFLASPAAQDALSADLPSDPLAAQKLLRKTLSADQAAAVGQITLLRKKAASSGRFPTELAGRMLATDKLLQQASSMTMAMYLGKQMARIGECRTVWDLCCGMGADAIGLAQSGLDVVGVDGSPEAVTCAQYNVTAAGVGQQCRFEVQDVSDLSLDADAVIHIDPDRRASGRRVVQMDQYQPAETVLRNLIKSTRAGSMKLSAALSYKELESWEDVCLEYVSHGGVCRQLLVWWGLAGDEPQRKATVVYGDADDPQWVSLPAGRAYPAGLADGGWLVEPDPAVLAAGAVDDLADEFGIGLWCPGSVWLMSDKPLETPLARSYEILRVVPGRVKDIKRAIKELDGGIVEVKVRGVRLDTDKMQLALRGKGKNTLVVLWGRDGDKQTAFIARR